MEQSSSPRVSSGLARHRTDRTLFVGHHTLRKTPIFYRHFDALGRWRGTSGVDGAGSVGTTRPKYCSRIGADGRGDGIGRAWIDIQRCTPDTRRSATRHRHRCDRCPCGALFPPSIRFSPRLRKRDSLGRSCPAVRGDHFARYVLSRAHAPRILAERSVVHDSRDIRRTGRVILRMTFSSAVLTMQRSVVLISPRHRYEGDRSGSREIFWFARRVASTP